jgi:hypothetical protein
MYAARDRRKRERVMGEQRHGGAMRGALTYLNVANARGATVSA